MEIKRNNKSKVWIGIIFCLSALLLGNSKCELIDAKTVGLEVNQVKIETTKDFDEQDEPDEIVIDEVEHVIAVQKKNNIQLEWDENIDADGYIIERKTSGNPYQEIVKVSGEEVSFIDDSVQYGVTYTYRIRAYIGDTKSDGTIVKVTMKLSTAKLTVKRQGKNAKLSWKKVDGASGYAIYMSGSKNGSYKRIKTISSGKTITYTKKKISEKKAYYFKIRSFVKIENKEVYSNYSSVCKLNLSKNQWIKDKFRVLMKKYPDGKYWNHKDVSIQGRDISTIVTKNPCVAHSGWRSSCNYYDCPDGTIGYQCHGFAWKMCDLIFGENAPVKRYSKFSEAKIGDVIRIQDVHTIIILEKHKDYVLAGEANVGGTCMIRWGLVYTKDDLKNSKYYTRY